MQCSHEGFFYIGAKATAILLPDEFTENQFDVHIEQRQRSKKKSDLSESDIVKGIYIKAKATSLPD